MEDFSFEQTVFDEELADIRNRKIADSSDQQEFTRGDGLPDFEKLLAPESRRTSTLNTLLEELTSAEAEEKWNADSSVKHTGLVGLAFSGGGIRSATFNLGILQGLQKLGLFKCVDYLSTVSGGGYIGSCISSLLASTKGKPRDQLPPEQHFPFTHKPGEREPDVFRHLRNNANYLAPEGLLGILRIPMYLLRGIVINFLIILPYILLAACITLLIKPDPQSLEAATLEHIDFFNYLATFLGHPFLGTKCLLILLALTFIAYPAAFMYLQKVGDVSNWASRNRFGKFLSLYAVIIGAVFAIELQPAAIRALHDLKTEGWTGWQYGVFGSSVLTLFGDKLLPHLSRVLARVAVYLLGLLGVVVVWLVYLNLCDWGIWGLEFDGRHLARENLLVIYGVTALLLWLYSVLTVDVNFTSIHKFYRDRLSKAFLVKFGPDNKIVHEDVLKLSELDSQYAPYHLINTLLNLEKPEESHKQGRHGDFFIFSKKFIGGEITRYCRTTDMERSSRHVDLATAMAISGAAAAPNMGKLTIKPLIFILALLNIRLNYWLPNPKKLRSRLCDSLADRLKGQPRLAATCDALARHIPRAPWNRVGPIYLIRELFGDLDADDSYVNLSDGGHIENLGIYELLRRECRLIIAGDGEADSSLEFGGLSEVIRMALIDFGIEIEMDGLDELRRGEKHHAVGTIKYRNGRVGKLIYLKLSMLGDNNLQSTLTPENYTTSPYRDDNDQFDDNPYIAYYKKLYPDFPHQSTGDQFFDEAQFECYRALGYEVATSALGK